MAVRFQTEDFDVAAEIAALRDAAAAGGADVGAVASFTGICRSEGGRLAALELEIYPDMAMAEVGRIVEEANSRWPLSGTCVIHRYGRIEAGDNIVLVVTASTHRRAAFEAAEFLMDYLKTRAPIWKKEHLAGHAGEWVEARQADDEAAGRWAEKS